MAGRYAFLNAIFSFQVENLIKPGINLLAYITSATAHTWQEAQSYRQCN